MFTLALVGFANAALAQTGVEGGSIASWSDKLLIGIVDSLVYSIMGIIVLVIAFKAKDLLLPGNLAKQLVEEKNVALAIVTGAFLLGVSIIIAAVLSH